MVTAKIGDFVVDIVTRVAVRGWGDSWRDVLAVAKTEGGGVTILAVYTAKIEGGGGENFVVLAVTVITAKKGGLLAKNVANEGGRRGRNIKNDPF